MNYRRHLSSPKLCLVGLLLASIGAAPARSLRPTPTATPIGQIFIPKSPSWQWVNEPWTSSDAPYSRIQTEIDMTLAHKQLTSTLLEHNKELAFQSYDTPQTVFRWAYTLYKAPYAGIWIPPFDPYEEISRAFERAASPHSYKYARLRFLLMTQWYNFPQLKRAGYRLLRRNPTDYDVKYFMVFLLKSSRIERQQALAYAKDLIHMRPNRYSAYGSLGDAYAELFFQGDDHSAKEKAIAAYQRFLQLAPPSNRKRQGVQYLIRLLRRGYQNHHHK